MNYDVPVKIFFNTASPLSLLDAPLQGMAYRYRFDTDREIPYSQPVWSRRQEALRHLSPTY